MDASAARFYAQDLARNASSFANVLARLAKRNTPSGRNARGKNCEQQREYSRCFHALYFPVSTANGEGDWTEYSQIFPK